MPKGHARRGGRPIEPPGPLYDYGADVAEIQRVKRRIDADRRREPPLRSPELLREVSEALGRAIARLNDVMTEGAPARVPSSDAAPGAESPT